MAWILVVLLWILKTTEGKDAQLTCFISERCTLNCTIEPHGVDVVIHWYHAKNDENPVHSYYQGMDRLAYQDPKYRGRTSLFTDLISPGNASLLLTDVKIQDQGRYKCYTSTKKGNDEQFVNLMVEGPIKSVDITLVKDTLTCSSEDLFPTPTLVWSTDPPSEIHPETAPETQSNAQGLFSITSSVMKTSNSTYICTVTAGQNTWTSSLKQQSLSANAVEELIIPCSVPGANANLKDFTLTWLFNGDMVLTYDSRTSQRQVHKRWQDHMKYTDKQTEIKLHNMLSGTYSCVVSSAEFRHSEETVITIQQSQDGNGFGSIGTAGKVLIPVFIVLLIGLLVVYFRFWRKRQSVDNGPESHSLNNNKSKDENK